MSDSSSVLRIRRAASLALGVTGISLVVYQTNWPPVLVSRTPHAAPTGEVWIHARPCQVRHELCGTPVAQRVLLGPTLGVTEADVHIELIVNDGTTVDAAGLFTVRHDDRRSEVGFVAPAWMSIPERFEAAACDGCPRRRTVMPPPVVGRPDHGLGTRLVSWVYPTHNYLLATSVRGTAFDTMLAMTVDEVVHDVAAE
ncbi:MAG: hypothetical protein AAGA42_05605 [Actinomycetota bacterium]